MLPSPTISLVSGRFDITYLTQNINSVLKNFEIKTNNLPGVGGLGGLVGGGGVMLPPPPPHDPPVKEKSSMAMSPSQPDPRIPSKAICRVQINCNYIHNLVPTIQAYTVYTILVLILNSNWPKTTR